MVADETAGIYARGSPVLGRYVQLGIAQGRVLSVEFPDDVTDVETDHELLDTSRRTSAESPTSSRTSLSR